MADEVEGRNSWPNSKTVGWRFTVQLEVMLQGNSKTSLGKWKQAQLLTCGTPPFLQLGINSITQQQLLPSKHAHKHVKMSFLNQEYKALIFNDHKQKQWFMPTDCEWHCCTEWCSGYKPIWEMWVIFSLLYTKIAWINTNSPFFPCAKEPRKPGSKSTPIECIENHYTSKRPTVEIYCKPS